MEIFNCAAVLMLKVCASARVCVGRRMAGGGTRRRRRSDADQKITEIMNGIKRTERLNGSPTTVKRSGMFPLCEIFARQMLFLFAVRLIISIHLYIVFSIFFNFNFPLFRHSDFPT